MNKFDVLQVNFNGGIAETVKQNANQSGQLQSVLWLNNYNPNLEQFSAVMRPGIYPIKEIQSDVEFSTSSWVKLLLSELTLLHGSDYDNTVLGVIKMQMSNPEFADTYLLFLKRKPTDDINLDYLPDDHELVPQLPLEATCIAVLVYNPNNDIGTRTKLWYEVFKEPNIIYRGWYTFGTMQDFSRWGETILFVTKMIYPSGITDPNKAILNKYLYPVYKWTYWNLSKKRELGDDRYFSGLDFGLNNEKLNIKRYIVESPALSLQQDNKLFEAVEVDKGRLGTDIRKLINIETQQDITAFTKDITLLFWEKDLAEEVNYFADIRYTVGDSSTRSTPYATMSFLKTFEVPDNAKALSEMKDYLTTNYSYYKYIKSFDVKGKHLIVFAPNSSFDKQAIGFALPNYIDAKMPRLWLEDEKVPYIVTMIINGQEIIIDKGTKRIKLATQWQTNIEDSTSFSADETSRYENGAQSLDLTFPAASDGIVLYIAPMNNKSSDDLEPTLTNGPNIILPKVYPVLYFSLRISQIGLKKLISNNVQSIRIYVSQPHETKSVFRSIGTTFYDTPPPVTYHYPAVDRLDDNEIDYTKFGLVKEFKIDGKGDYIDDYNDYRGELHNTNAWKESWDFSKDVFSTVQEDGDDYPEARELLLLDTEFETAGFTPDFIIWDYPTDRPTLQLGGSGKYWQGLGSGLILVIKGRVFIGKCIDKDGKEEQGLMRYCAMQGPVILYGTFYDEHKLYIGHLSHVAYLEFREQGIIFTRKDHFRYSFNDITDETTWELMEHYEGHGTFCKKTCTSTPFGYIYCNENGIWLSDGSIPKSLTDNLELSLNINSLYRKIAIRETYIYTSIVDPGEFTIDEKLKYNLSLELNYDSYHNELVLSAVKTNGTEEIRLIFSFSKRNWRIETYDLTFTKDEVLGTILSYSESQRIKFDNVGLINTNIIEASDIPQDQEINFSKEDITIHETGSAYKDNCTWNDSLTPATNDIEGEIITHEIGDGRNDFNLHSILAEVIPTDEIFNISYIDSVADKLSDPELSIELRNRDNIGNLYQRLYEVPVNETETDNYTGWFNIFRHNLRTRGVTNPFNSQLQIPQGNEPLNDIDYTASDGDTGTGEIYDKVASTDGLQPKQIKNPARESFILNAPLNSIFRHMRIKFISKLIKKVRSFEINTIIRRRRSI